MARLTADFAHQLLQANDDRVRHAEAVKKSEFVQAMLRTEATEAVRKLAATAGECDALRAQVGSQLEVITSLASKTTPATDESGQGGAAKPLAPPKKAK